MKPPSANSTSYSVGGDFLALLNTEKFLKIFDHYNIYPCPGLATCPVLLYLSRFGRLCRATRRNQKTWQALRSQQVKQTLRDSRREPEKPQKNFKNFPGFQELCSYYQATWQSLTTYKYI